MNILFLILVILIFVVYLLKDSKENFKSKTWGFGMFEVPIFSITVDENN